MNDLELEALLRCEPCAATPYRLFRRRARQLDGEPIASYEHVLWPTAPEIAPPARADRIRCPACGGELKRVAA